MKKCVMLAGLGVLALTQCAWGAGTITSGNASLQFVGVPVFSSNLGDANMKTDTTGPDQLYKLTWYYRTPFNNTNRFMSSLDTPTETYSGNTATFNFPNAGPGVAGQERFDAVVTTTLTDGSLVNQSRVVTSCRFKSHANTTLTYNVFVVIDLDIAGGSPNPATDDLIVYNASSSIGLQNETSSSNYATIGAINPTRWQVGSGTAIRALMNGGSANLSSTGPAFTGDACIAFQWTPTLTPGQEVVLTAAFAINDTPFCSNPTITLSPADTNGCPSDTKTFNVAGSDATSYQWQIESPVGSNSYVNITGPSFTEAATGLIIDVAGATTSQLAVSNVRLGTHPNVLKFLSRAINSCGSTNSQPAQYTINDCTPTCYADFNQDGGIDGGDVSAFFQAWEAGDGSADVNQDGGVDGADIATFFVAWEAGSC
jgi:hypothetical protein